MHFGLLHTYARNFGDGLEDFGEEYHDSYCFRCDDGRAKARGSCHREGSTKACISLLVAAALGLARHMLRCHCHVVLRNRGSYNSVPGFRPVRGRQRVGIDIFPHNSDWTSQATGRSSVGGRWDSAMAGMYALGFALGTTPRWFVRGRAAFACQSPSGQPSPGLRLPRSRKTKLRCLSLSGSSHLFPSAGYLRHLHTEVTAAHGLPCHEVAKGRHAHTYARIQNSAAPEVSYVRGILFGDLVARLPVPLHPTPPKSAAPEPCRLRKKLFFPSLSTPPRRFVVGFQTAIRGLHHTCFAELTVDHVEIKFLHIGQRFSPAPVFSKRSFRQLAAGKENKARRQAFFPSLFRFLVLSGY